MISVEEARERILAHLTPVATEIIGLGDAWGRVLAVDLAARRTQPPFGASAMDGYAVRGADIATIPQDLRLIGHSQAGTGFAGTLAAGEAVRIFTGAPVPAGADTVVIQENTRAVGDVVTVTEAAETGANIRAAGVDFTAGNIGLRQGVCLSARAIGLAAAMDYPWIPVHRQPRIAILATGDEVVMPGEPLGPHQIIGSNGPAIAALVRAAGGIPILLGIVADDRQALTAAIRSAAGCDLLVTIGGASLGDHDLVHGVLEQAGATLDFWKVAMRPGKPLMFGMLDGLPVLGLPGNPVSALVTALIFLRPAIDRLNGLAVAFDDGETIVTTVALPANGPRQDYIRATLSAAAPGGMQVTPLTGQDSSLTRVLAAADCLIRRPPHAEPAAAGTGVPVIRLDQF